MDSEIVFSDVSYWYPHTREPVLDDVSLSVDRGEFLLVVGSSGSGKSTFLRALNGLVPHFSGGEFKGNVSVSGIDTRKASTVEIAHHVGSVFQDPESQFIMSTPESEIVFGLENMCLSQSEIASRLSEVMDFFSLIGLSDRPVQSLSSGEKQKVVLASVVAMRPEVVVLDEPTSQLDPLAASEFLSILRDLNLRLGLTVVLAEHRVDRLLGFADRVFDLDSGRIGTPQDILPNVICSPPIASLKSRLSELGFHPPESLIESEFESYLKPHISSFKPLSPGRNRLARKEVLRLNGVSKSFGKRKVLDDLSISFSEGEFTALMGENGAGKTTLIKTVMGLITPDSGRIIVSGLDVSQSKTSDLSRIIGFVSQNPNDYLFSETVADELSYTLRNLGVKGDVEEYLSQMGLLGKSGCYPRDLSGGERQRVALASVLVGDPSIIIFDEPTRGLDTVNKSLLSSFMRKLCDKGKTVIFVTHDVETVATSTDRVVILKEGRVRDDGATRDVLNRNQEYMPQIAKIFPTKNYLTVDEAVEGLK